MNVCYIALSITSCRSDLYRRTRVLVRSAVHFDIIHDGAIGHGARVCAEYWVVCGGFECLLEDLNVTILNEVRHISLRDGVLDRTEEPTFPVPPLPVLPLGRCVVVAVDFLRRR